MAHAEESQNRVAAVRRFNRFYTRQIGVLRRNYLDSPYSLGEMRVLYETGAARLGGARTASDIGRALDLDAGYLSPRAAQFREARPDRAQDLRRGRAAKPSRAHRARPQALRAVREALASASRRHARQAWRRRTGAAGRGDADDRGPARRQAPRPSATYSLRAPRHGDFGWIVARHAELYAQEYGWGEPFEGLCAQIVADFVNNYDAKRERCWIAEMDGENVGCVMLVKDFDRGRAPPPAAGRSEGARARARRAAGRRMRDVRARGRLQEDHAMDAQRAHRRAPHL